MDGILPPTFVKGFHDETSVKKVKYSKLGNTDLVVSNFSLGGTGFGQNQWGPVSMPHSISIVDKAFRAGINYVDTSPWYGQGKSEEVLGHVLQKFPREAFFIATKVGRYELNTPTTFDFSRATVEKNFHHSLSLLQMEYVDLIQIHDVEFCHSIDQIVNHTLPLLQEFKAKGKARYVGITGYNLGVLKRIVERAPVGAVDTVLSYCRFNLQNQDLRDYLDFFASRGVGVINASPVGMGLLTDDGHPHWHPSLDSTKEVCQAAAEYCRERGVCLPELAIKWCLHQPQLTTSLTSVTTPELTDMNLTSVRNPLTPSELQLCEELQTKFFGGMISSHWENVEVENYWKKMEAGGWKQNVD